MTNPRREMRTARTTYKVTKQGERRQFRQDKRAVNQVFKGRREQAKQLFSERPKQMASVNRQLKVKRSSDLKHLKATHTDRVAEHQSAYVDKVLASPSQVLTAKELKQYKLPELKRQHDSSREALRTAKKELQAERRREAFSYRQSDKKGSNFGQRQTNFQAYQGKKATVQVRVSQSYRAKHAFEQAKQGKFSFKAQASDTIKEQYYRFKREGQAESKIKQTASGRFWYEKSPELKEKETAYTKFKADARDAKDNLKQGQRVYRWKRPRTKVLLAGKFLAKEAVHLLEEDDLSGLRDLEQVARKSVNYSKFAYEGTKTSISATRNTYRFGRNRWTNLKERVGNFKAGKGFSLNNPKRHLNQRIRNYFKRVKRNLVHSGKRAVTFIKDLPHLITSLFSNPLTWKIAGGAILLILFMSLFIGAGSRILIQQDEFELTKAYTHMTKEDAENSLADERGTTYYTKIDEVMAYMNYRFQDYELTDSIPEPTAEQLANLNATSLSGQLSTNQGKTYKDYLTTLWHDLNKGSTIQSMSDLYTTTSSQYALSDEAIEELKEYESEGIYLGLFELDNPFQGQTDEDTLTMTYRYGYYAIDDKVEKSNHIILEAIQGQVVVAPMDGLIKLDGEDVLIVSGEGKIVESRLRLKDIADGSVQSGQKVYTGDLIGAVKSNQGLTIEYQKYNDHKEKLVYVNPAFYFHNVVQLQTTIVASIGQFQGDEVARAKQVYEYLKAKGASNQFIAGVLGNWSVESGVNPKRAEGDYLSPPIGASESSWDDPNWLSMNGPTIYNGRFPNILHRGLGLGQWTDTADGAVRHTLLRNYAASKGKPWYDLELQLDFMLNGDSPYYTNWVATHMKDTGSPAALAQLFLIYWEGNAGDKLAERQSRAVEWFYQIERGFSQPNGGTAQSDMAALESVRGDLYENSVPGGGDGMGYAFGQCTWGVAARMNQLGLKLKGRNGESIPITSQMGNGQDWVNSAAALGGEIGSVPREGAIISFAGGSHGTLPEYGHVSFVEKVYPDGSFLVSETNVNGNPNYTFRKFQAADANMSFAYTQK